MDPVLSNNHIDLGEAIFSGSACYSQFQDSAAYLSRGIRSVIQDTRSDIEILEAEEVDPGYLKQREGALEMLHFTLTTSVPLKVATSNNLSQSNWWENLAITISEEMRVAANQMAEDDPFRPALIEFSVFYDEALLQSFDSNFPKMMIAYDRAMRSIRDAFYDAEELEQAAQR